MNKKTGKIEKGGKYGKLTALKLDYVAENGKQYWLFRCDCGKEKVIESYNAVCGNTQSCGCKYKESEIFKNYKGGSNLEHLLEVDKKPKKNNRTGIRGIFYEKSRNKYQAQIQYRGKRYALGRYNTPEEAQAARKEAEEEIKDGTFLENWEQRKNKR